MRGHFDALQIGAGVVGRPHLAPPLDRVAPGPEDRHQKRGLIRRQKRRAHEDLVAHIVDTPLTNRAQGGQPLFHRQQIAGADLVGCSPLRVTMDQHLDAPFLLISASVPPGSSSKATVRGAGQRAAVETGSPHDRPQTAFQPPSLAPAGSRVWHFLRRCRLHARLHRLPGYLHRRVRLEPGGGLARLFGVADRDRGQFAAGRLAGRPIGTLAPDPDGRSRC